MPSTKLKLVFIGAENPLMHTLPDVLGKYVLFSSVLANDINDKKFFLDDVNLIIFNHSGISIDQVSKTICTCKIRFPQAGLVVLTEDYSGSATKSFLRSGADDVLPISDSAEEISHHLINYISLYHSTAKTTLFKNTFVEKVLLTATIPTFLLTGSPAIPLSTAMLNNDQSISVSPVGEAYQGLEVKFFGTFTSLYHGKPLILPNKAKSIFAFMCYSYPKPQSAEYLSKVFWPDKYEVSPERAKRSLNVEITNIRNAFRHIVGLKDHVINFEKGFYKFNLKNPILSDVHSFKYVFKDINKNKYDDNFSSKEVLLQEIINIYQGNFLDDFSEGSFNWIDIERQHLSLLFEQISELYIDSFLAQSEFSRAAAMCEELLDRDARLSSIYCKCMECYSRIGKRNNIRSLYDKYCRMMSKEFDSPPSPDVTAVYNSVMKNIL